VAAAGMSVAVLWLLLSPLRSIKDIPADVSP
jgi:hypothetical protein